MTRTLTALGILAPDARCECVGGCGREHKKTGDNRCHVIDAPGHPLALVAAGRTTVKAAELGRDDLVAWCPVCCTHAAQAAHRSTVMAAEHDGPDLLDLLGASTNAAGERGAA